MHRYNVKSYKLQIGHNGWQQALPSAPRWKVWLSGQPTGSLAAVHLGWYVRNITPEEIEVKEEAAFSQASTVRECQEIEATVSRAELSLENVEHNT